MKRIEFDRHHELVFNGDLECVKTGADAYIEPYDEWVHGDAFMSSGTLVLRIAGVSERPFGPRRHFTVINADHWFDKMETSMARNSTLIVAPRHYVPHGYQGLSEPKEKAIG